MAEAILGFDFGLKRIGIAVGQTVTATASPLTTVRAEDGTADWDRIAELVRTWKPAAFVVGLPYNMDGSEQELASRARGFARQLAGRYGLPVHTVDERLTSREAEARLREQRAGGRGRQVSREDIDEMAACIILESWFAEQTRNER